MKKLLTILLAAMMVTLSAGALTACGPSGDYIVGVIKFVKHEALDLAEKGFKDELTKLMAAEGKTVGFSSRDAKGEVSTAQTIANTHVAKKRDLILAIATPAAQQAANATNDIPVLFTAVTDAEIAQLVESNSVPGGNVSGTSDLNPLKEQLDLITELVPGIQKFAVMYDNNEANSRAQYTMMQQLADAKGITAVDHGIADKLDIAAKMSTIANAEDIQAIYIPTDNTLADAAALVHQENQKLAKLPIVCGETNMNDLCGVATYGIDYEDLGKQTAQMAFEILINEADIKTMAVRYAPSVKLSVNQTVAGAIGFTVPSAIIDRNGEEKEPDYSVAQ